MDALLGTMALLLAVPRQPLLLCESKSRHLQAEHRDLILESVSIFQETATPRVEKFQAHGLVTKSSLARANT